MHDYHEDCLWTYVQVFTPAKASDSNSQASGHQPNTGEYRCIIVKGKKDKNASN